jgi:hypothetical protein
VNHNKLKAYTGTTTFAWAKHAIAKARKRQVANGDSDSDDADNIPHDMD